MNIRSQATFSRSALFQSPETTPDQGENGLEATPRVYQCFPAFSADKLFA